MTTSPRDISARLIAIATPVCEATGYELVDVDYESGNAGWVVRFYIDRAAHHVSGAGGITFADCETLSRELGAVLDVEDPVPHAYSLEVSSPGVARPLRTAEHFRQQVGQVAKVALGQGIDGRHNFKGTVLAVEPREGGADVVLLETEDGKRFALPVDDVDKGRLIPDWDAVLKNQAAKEAAAKPPKPAKTKSKSKSKSATSSSTTSSSTTSSSTTQTSDQPTSPPPRSQD